MKRALRLLAAIAGAALLLVVGLWALARAVGDHDVEYAGSPVSAWAALLRDPDPAVRNGAGKTVDAVVVPGLLRAITTDTNDSPVRVFLAEQLNSLPGLRVDLTPTEGRRITAVNDLALLGEHAKPAHPLLLDLLRDDDPVLLGAAAQALQRLGEDPDVLVPLLVKRCTDPEGNGRPDVVKVLGDLGPKAKAAAPKLVSMLGDHSSKEIVSAVPRALKQVDPEAAARAGVR